MISMQVRRLWAQTRVVVQPEAVRLASLPLSALGEAAQLLARSRPAFAALLVEPGEVSLTVSESAWQESGLRDVATSHLGPFRAITLDVAVDVSVVGYFAPAAARLAEEGIAIVPQCAFTKDHLLVAAADISRATACLEALVAESKLAFDKSA